MNAYASSVYLFKPRFPWISLVLGAWLLTRGAMFLGLVLLAYAVSRIWRWKRGPAAAPNVHFHVRRGGMGGAHAGGRRRPSAGRPSFESVPETDEARVA